MDIVLSQSCLSSVETIDMETNLFAKTVLSIILAHRSCGPVHIKFDSCIS